ncbi:MAG: hypothetical protein JW759_04515 [Candidatus Coatesbacteria bacterium]|nr:hypothetical protein [Candidatus Coatesbacteria bacterium]
MSRGSSRLCSLIAVALMVFCVGAAARAAIPLETIPSWHSTDELRTYDVEWYFATAGSIYPDLYAANIDGPVEVYLNSKADPVTIGATPVALVAVSGNAIDIDFGDFNCDGYNDMALVLDNGSVEVYRATTGTIATDWTLVWQSCQIPTANTTKVKWAYINDDNYMDLITIGDPDYVKVYYSDGIGSFRTNSGCSDYPTWESPSEYHALSIDVGDVNGDGGLNGWYQDFVIGTGDGDPIYLFIFDPSLGPDGYYMPDPVWQSDGTPITRGVLLRDFDKDEQLDLAAGNVGDPSWIFVNTGADPWFHTTPDWASDQSNDTYDIAAADFDVDSDPGTGNDLELVEGNFAEADVIYLNNTTTIGLLNMTTSPVWVSEFATGETLSLAVADIGEELNATEVTIDPELAAGDWDQYNVIYINFSELGPYLDNQIPAEDELCVGLGADFRLPDCGTCSTLSNIYFQVWASAPGASITSIKVFVDATTSSMQEVTASCATNAVNYDGIAARFWEVCYYDPTVWNWGDWVYVRVNATDSNLRFRSMTYSFHIMDDTYLYASDPEEGELWPAGNTLWFELGNTCCTITTAYSDLHWTGPFGPTEASLNVLSIIGGPTLYTVLCQTQSGYPLGPGHYTWCFWTDDSCGKSFEEHRHSIHFTVVGAVWPGFRGPGWPTSQCIGEHVGTTFYPAYMECPSRRWSYPKSGDPQVGDFYASPVKDWEASVYAIDSDGYLSKVASGGTLVWSVDTGGLAADARFSPVLGPTPTINTIVYVPLGSVVRAYYTVDGTEVSGSPFAVTVGNRIRSSLLLFAHNQDWTQPMLAFGTRADVPGNNFFVCDANEATLFSPICADEITGQHIMSTPAADMNGDYIWVATDSGEVHKYDWSACAGPVATFDTSVYEGGSYGLIHGSPAIATDGAVYFGDDAGFFFCIGSDATLGTRGWYVETGDTIHSSPALFSTGATLCVTYGDNSGTLWVFGAYQATFAVVSADAFFTAGPQAGPGTGIFNGVSVSADGYIYYGSENGRLYCADATQGGASYDHNLWDIYLGDYVETAPAIGWYGEVDVCTATGTGAGGVVYEIISDCNAPSTSCLAFDYSRFGYTNVPNFQLRYLGTDYQSGVESIDFYRKPKFGGSYQNIGTVYPPAPGFTVSGTFDTSLSVEGTYHYYTIGFDRAPNEENPPANYDCAIIYDATEPLATCSTTTPWTTAATLSVCFTAWEDISATTSVSGLHTVKLYTQFMANNCGASWGSWQEEIAYETTYATGTTLATGCAAWTPPSEGYYNFAFVASDWAGNTMTEPPVASCSSTVVDYTEPESWTIGCDATNNPVITRSYAASDAISGLDQIDLYYWYSPDGGASWPGGLTWACTVQTDPDADDTACVWDGDWTYTVAAEGIYRFVMRALDNVGNWETLPTSESEPPYYQIYYDITQPETWAITNDTYWNYDKACPTCGTIEVCFDSTFPEPGGSGLEQVTLWWRMQVDCTGSWTPWTDTLTEPITGPTICSTTATVLTSGCWYFPAADACYPAEAAWFEFYTIGEDFSGNTEAIPGIADDDAMYENTPPQTEAYAVPEYANTPVNLGLDYWDDPGTCASGIATVASLMQYEGQSTWSTIAGVMIPTTGTVAWAPGPYGEGLYRILSNAQDRAGNWEYRNESILNAQPADDWFVYDISDPVATLTCVSPPYLSSVATLHYDFNDENASGTTVAGLDYTLLWGWDASTGTVCLLATDSSVYGNTGPGTSSFTFTAPHEGLFGLYTTAYDRATNFEAGAVTECTVTFDWTLPTSTITSVVPTVATADPADDCIAISFIATDAVSGVAEVHLFYRYTEDGGASWEPDGVCGWRDYNDDVPGSTAIDATSGTFSFCFDDLLNGDLDGYYEFYTHAIDHAGNNQATLDNDHDGCQDAYGFCLRDTTGPWSSAECTEGTYPNHIAGTSIVEICYEAGDGSGLNLDLVELWFRYYMSYYSTWTHWTTDSTLRFEPAPVATSGVFYFDTLNPYNANWSAYGDGIYQFFTRARDEAGNWEYMPSYPPRDYDTYLMVDTTAPTGSCDLDVDVYTSGPFEVSYTSSDGLSGISYVELWYATYTTVWLWATEGSISAAEVGSFTFDPSAHAITSGALRFYVQAHDAAGNAMAVPSDAAGCGPVYIDVDNPAITCDSPAYTLSPTFDIDFAAEDATTWADTVDLFYSFEGSDWVDAGMGADNSGAVNPFTGAFTFAAENGEGEYTFRLVATDPVGHTAFCETITVFDETKPQTEVTGDEFVIGGAIELTLFGEDPQSDSRMISGIDYVELFYEYAVDGDFTGASWMTTGITTATIDTLGTYTTPPWNPVDGDGWYRFCTIGHDNAGNVEAFPYHYDWELAYQSGASLVTSFCWTMNNQEYWNEEIVIEYIATPTTTALDHVELWYRYRAYAGASWTDWSYSGYIGYEIYGKFNFSEFDYGEGLYQFYTHAIEVSGLEEEHNADPNMRYDCWGHYDRRAPESFASVAASYTNATNINVSIDFDDYLMMGGSGMDCIELWYRLEGGAWQHTGCQSIAGGPPQDVIFTATADGEYEFFSIAVDKSGNKETNPTDADGRIIRDVLEPWAIASAPAYTKVAALTVTYTGDDTIGTTPNVSGLDTVHLYYMFAANGTTWPGTWTDTGLVSDTGSFAFNLANGQGVYRFYAEATDKAGNVEVFNGAFEAQTVYDTNVPNSSCTSPTFSTDTIVEVTFTATDPQTGSIMPSGLAFTELWYRYFDAPTATWTGWMDSGLAGTGGSGVIDFDIDLFGYGEGNYQFYTIAVDNAGNRESAPAARDSATTVAITLPASMVVDALTPDYCNDGVMELYYAAASPAAAIADVDLWYRYAADGVFWSLWQPATATRFADRFEMRADVLPIPVDGVTDEGHYEFYTIATDTAGNVELPPVVADAGVITDITPAESMVDAPGCTRTDKVLVHFYATDELSGLARVELEIATVAGIWAPTGLSSTQGSGVMLFRPPVEGLYWLVTVAYDKAGNAEGDRDLRAVQMSYDMTRPETTLTRTVAASRSVPIAVDYSVFEEGCGLVELRLYYKMNPTDSRWIDCGLSTTSPDGILSFVPPGLLQGRYYLAGCAKDVAGNVEQLPAVPNYDIEVIYDVTPPVTTVPDPATRLLNDCETIGVSYIATDAYSPIKTVGLYYKHEDGAWTDSLLRKSSATGEFSFTPADSGGIYYFIMVSEDVAGNAETFVPTDEGMAWFMFDRESPYIVSGSMDPAPGGSGYPRDAAINFTVADDGYGVDVTSIEVEVIDAYGRNITATTIAMDVNPDGSVDVAFVPSTLYGYEDTITVYVTACDLVPSSVPGNCENCIETPESWSFSVTGRQVPQLSNGSVTPEVGYVPLNTEFTYEVKYVSATADIPTTKRVYIDGISHQMTLVAGSEWNGTYQFEISSMAEGVHAYYFLFATQGGDQARWPAVGSEQGPTVHAEMTTTLSCTVLPEVPTVLDTLLISGTLGTGATAATIEINIANPVTSFTKTAVTTTGGDYVCEASASVIGPWSVSALWAGNADYSPVESAIVEFEVGKIATALELSVTPHSIRLGETVDITGRLNAVPVFNDGVVYIELVNPVGERSEGIEAELLPDGTFELRDFDMLNLLGTWQLVGMFDGTAEYEASESESVTVVVSGGDAAILINGYSDSVTAGDERRTTIEYVYQTLRRRGLSHDDIYYLTNMEQSRYVDAGSNEEEYDNVITALANKIEAGDAPGTLYIVLMGQSRQQGAFFTLQLADDLSYPKLHADLGMLKGLAPAMKTVGVMAFDASQRFAEYLAVLADSVFISTAAAPDGHTYPVPGAEHGDLFVAEFFSAVASDKSVEVAFDMAYDSAKVLHEPQEPMMFDHGAIAPTTDVGSWTIRGDMAPVIVDYAEGTTVPDSGATPTTIDLWVKAEDDYKVAQVYALIMTQGYEPGGAPFTGASTAQPIDLVKQVGGYWTGEFDIAGPGAYDVAYVAMDNRGNISELASTVFAMAQLEIELELSGHYFFWPGDTVQVSLGYTNGNTRPVYADLYIVVQIPGNHYWFLGGVCGDPWVVSTPYWTGYVPTGHMDPFPIFWMSVPTSGGYEGTYYWIAALVEPGTTWNIIAASEIEAMEVKGW